MQDEIAHRVYAEEVDKVFCVNDVALRFAHFAAVHQKPRVTEHLLRQRQVERHEENRPVDGVETDDVLADEVQVCRPITLELLGGVAVAVVTDAGDVVCERVEPNIHDVLVVKIDRNAPLEGGSGNAEILQAGQEEVVHHFRFALRRLNELRVLIDVVDEAVCILAHLEEVCLFLRGLDLAAAVRALAVDKLGLGEEGLTRRAVHALVVALINIALLVELFKDLLYLLFVVIVRGADEFIVGGVHHVPVRLDNLRDVVDIFLRGDAGGIGLFFNLLAVLVRAGLEVDIVALHALIARNAVGEHDLIRVADVRAAGGVGDSRRNIILRFTHGWIIPLQCIFKGLVFSTVECIQLNSTAESAERIISPAKIAAPMRTMSLRCFSVFIESSFRGCRACLYVYPLFYHSFFHL